MPRGGQNKVNLTGQKFGMLSVLSEAPKQGGKSYWLCRCDCGGTHTVAVSHLRSGAIGHCGCVKRARFIRFATKHGHSRLPEFQVWLDMRKRCSNPRDKAYKNYGARGITVCERWAAFENFLEDMGRRPIKTAIDRIDNDKGYSPDNCRWVSHTDNCNNRRNNIFIEYGGQRRTLSEWARHLGINQSTLYDRLRRKNWPVERALSEPSQSRPTRTGIAAN
jgi:hypothetical protein